MYGQLTSAKYLYLLYNALTDDVICYTKLNTLSQLLLLNISFNKIKWKSNLCSQQLPQVQEFSLQRNCLNIIKSHSFQGFHNLKSLDISKNEIRVLQYCAFCELKLLQVLNLLSNNIYQVSSSLFGKGQLQIVHSDDFHICCIIKELKTSCTSTPSWPSSCNHLLASKILRCTNWIVSASTFCFNVISAIPKVLILKKNPPELVHIYTLLVI